MKRVIINPDVMMLANRKILTIALSGSAICLTLIAAGTWLLHYSWFTALASSPWVGWFMPFLVLAAFIGTPMLLTILNWRWEPQAKSWPAVLLRWAIGLMVATIGWVLTMTAVTGVEKDLPTFFKTAFIDPGLYLVAGGGVALVGFLDWFFITRHTKKIATKGLDY